MAVQQGAQNVHDIQRRPEGTGNIITPRTAQTPQVARQVHEYRGSVVFPLLLVGLGVLFLLNNMGLVSWNIWNSIWQLWPLLLVAAGIDMIIGRRSTAASIFTVMTLFGLMALIAIGIWILAMQQAVWQPQGDQETQQIAQTLDDANKADIDIRFGAGTLHLSAQSDSSDLVRGSLELRRGEEADSSFSVDNGTAYYRLESKASGFLFPFISEMKNERIWDLNLNTQVPTDLKVNTGVGEAVLDLEDLKLTRLDLNGGAGNTTLTLPKYGDYEVQVNAGVGRIDLGIPAGLALRMEVNDGLGQIDIQGDYKRQGKQYESAGYNAATNRVDLKVEGGIGQITIHELSND